MTESGQGLSNDERVMIDRVLDLQKIPYANWPSFDELPEIKSNDRVAELVRNHSVKPYTRLPVWTENAASIDCRCGKFAAPYSPETEWQRPVGDFLESTVPG